MKMIHSLIVLFLSTNLFVTYGGAAFEPFVYQDTPFEIDDNFEKTVQAKDFSNYSDAAHRDEGFIPLKQNGEVVEKIDTGVEDFQHEKIVQVKEVSPDFKSTGSEAQDRILTDAQKKAQKIFEERLAEDNRKLKILISMQEQEYLKMRQKVWKTFEAKADAAGQKQDFSLVKQQQVEQAQSLLQKLQASKSALLEKEKLANELANQLAKINAHRTIAAQRLQIQKTVRRSLARSVDPKTKQGNARLMHARNREQVNSESFLMLDKQFNDINKQLQDARNAAQDIRGKFQEIQQAIEQQLVPSSSNKEELY